MPQKVIHCSRIVVTIPTLQQRFCGGAFLAFARAQDRESRAPDLCLNEATVIQYAVIKYADTA